MAIPLRFLAGQRCGYKGLGNNCLFDFIKKNVQNRVINEMSLKIASAAIDGAVLLNTQSNTGLCKTRAQPIRYFTST